MDLEKPAAETRKPLSPRVLNAFARMREVANARVSPDGTLLLPSNSTTAKRRGRRHALARKQGDSQPCTANPQTLRLLLGLTASGLIVQLVVLAVVLLR